MIIYDLTHLLEGHMAELWTALRWQWFTSWMGNKNY